MPRWHRKGNSRTVACYDCNQQVANLASHRSSCPNSRINKSRVLSKSGRSGRSGRSGQSGKSRQLDQNVTTFLLLDVSGSMDGTRLESAKQAATACFDAMEDDDRFAVVTFDTKAFWKLKPRVVEQLRRQAELPVLMNRIFAQGCTALYDAIFLVAEQIHNKQNKNNIVVVTDGEDNSSTHSLAEALALLAEFPNMTLDIVHVGQQALPAYEQLVQTRGQYTLVQEEKIVTTTTQVFTKSYKLFKAIQCEPTSQTSQTSATSATSPASPAI